MLTTNFNVDKIINEIKLCNNQCNIDEMYKCSYDAGKYVIQINYIYVFFLNGVS